MKTYTFTHSVEFGNSEDVMSMLKSMDIIRDLRSPFTNFYIIKSSENAHTLATEIVKHRSDHRFFISEISSNREGLVGQDIWNFINDEID